MNAPVRRVPRLVLMLLVSFGLVFGFTVTGSSLAGAQLTSAECSKLIADGIQAREDLAKLLAKVAAGEIDPALASGEGSSATSGYVTDLITDSKVNTFGFIDASAGSPLDLCIPGGFITVVLDNTIMLFEGQCNENPCPLEVFIPAGLSCGPHTITATGTDLNGNPINQSTTFEVVGNCTTAVASTALPVTGSDVGRLLGVAAAMIVLGGAAVLGARRSKATV